MTEKYPGNQPKDILLENEPELSPEELERILRPLFEEYLEAITASPLFREALVNKWKTSWSWPVKTEIQIKISQNLCYLIRLRRGDNQSLWLTKHTFKDGERVLDESVSLTIKDTDLERDYTIQYSSAVQPIAENRDKIIILTRSQSAVEQAKAFLKRMKTDLLTP